MALAWAGFTVDAICPSGHPLSKTGALRRTHRYRGLSPLASIRGGITAANADFLIPCDDLATRQLHEIHKNERNRVADGSAISKLIERSLGAPDSFPIVYARTPFMQVAQAEGVRVPKTALVTTTTELETWIAGATLPVVLKSNGSSGGEGVRIVQTAEEAIHAFQKLQGPPGLVHGAKRALIDQDKTLIWPSILRSRPAVNVQEFVLGREATSLIACWNGTVLASLHFEVIRKLNSSGPATVLRLVENAEMASATEKMAHRLGLCGLHGFDFMLENSTENAYLIEINPRTTQVGHLTLGPGRDLPAALYAAVSRQTIQAAPRLTENDTIVLFPGEWTRNPESTFLRSAYHDVPWEEPDLVRAGLEKHRKQSRWYSQRKPDRSVSVVGIPHL
jgi:ATP-grasp domain